jgi:hypothetical protein
MRITNQNKIIVIGGSAAGPKAAARARRLDQHAEITIVQKEPDLSGYSSLGQSFHSQKLHGGYLPTKDKKQNY